MNWDILLKYLNNECTTAESREVQNWLNGQSENRQLLSYLQKRREQLNQPLKKEDIHTQWVLLLDRIFETQSRTGKPNPTKGLWLMGIAASLLIFSLTGWFYSSGYRSSGSKQLVVLQTPTGIGGRATLPDGSKVYMAPGSKLTYAKNYNLAKRELALSGEVFFNVKHIAGRPFIVHAENKLDVTVLGTSFNVYSRRGQNIEVKVATGLVGITANNRTSFLTAGNQLVYEPLNGQLKKSAVDYNNAACLENQTIFFENDNASQVAQKLQRRYNINVTVLPSANRHPRFSGEMKDTGLGNLMQGLGYATGLRYRNVNAYTIQLY